MTKAVLLAIVATASRPASQPAIREQLGLKLEAAKAKIEYRLIDHVERLAPDHDDQRRERREACTG